MMPVLNSIRERIVGTFEYNLSVILYSSFHISIARFTEICRSMKSITLRAPLSVWCSLDPGANEGHAAPLMIPEDNLRPYKTFP